MFLKELDYLSPNITLYYSKRSKHVSIISGILTIIHYSCLFIASLYYFISLVLRTSQEFFYYRQYIENPRTFVLDKNDLFHFVNLTGVNYDPRAYSIIGVHNSSSEVIENNSELNFDYWKYLPCDWNYDAPDELKKEIKYKENESLCIKGFYNHTSKKFFSSTHQDFTYPKLEHELGSEHSVFYGIIFQECQNESNYNIENNITYYESSKIKKEIKNAKSLVIYVIDQYISVENYAKPNLKFLQKTESGIFDKNVIVNNLHFSPTRIKTHNGFWFDSIEQLNTYSFDQSLKGGYEIQNKSVGGMAYFWMHNQIDVFTRTFLKIPDILASISGIEKFSYIFFFTINLLYNNFIVAGDFNKLLNITIDKTEKNFKEKEAKRRTILSVPTPQFSSLHFCGKTKSMIHSPRNEKKTLSTKNISLAATIKYYFKIDNRSYLSSVINFRKRLLSEEKVLKNELKLYKLLRVVYNDPNLIDDENLHITEMSVGNNLRTIVKQASAASWAQNISHINSNVDLLK